MTAHFTSPSMEADTFSGAAPELGVLTDREEAILRVILATASFAGALQLLEQVRMLQLEPSSDATCRIYVLHPDAPRSAYSRAGRIRIPGRYPVRSSEGTELGELAVWVDQGHLRALQYVSVAERAPMTLPPVEWVRVDSAVAAAVRTRGAAQAVAGIRAFTSVPVVAQARADATAGSVGIGRVRVRTVIAVAMCVTALMMTAFLLGHSGGADVDAARAAGERTGAQQGTAEGAIEGNLRGTTEGALAGRASTYQAAYDTALAQVRFTAVRRAALAARTRKAAAAQSAPAVVPNSSGDVTSCSGYRDGRGYWICSG